MDVPKNPLEEALARAADEPASRPDFYRALLDSEIFVIGYTDAPGDGQGTIPAGAKLSLVNFEKSDGAPFIPFFTSLEALRSVLRDESRYVAMPSRSFFEITRGATLVLNPGVSYGKEFFPREIDALLTAGVNHIADQRVVEKETKVILGQPAKYPIRMVGSLSKLFGKHPNVRAAYLCLMHDPAASSAPTLLVGIEGDGELGVAIREAGAIAVDTVPSGEMVDLTRVQRGDAGLSSYFIDSVKPFYERSWTARIRSIFSS
ncbi:enhanced serine sensitivity protein SseB C-terminal domain-containing protein [Xanthomonas campestris pv. zinniae]|uniref:enhanced serine sensitivity protein SseB C-terminal domain-containing protein n=1 Tax=Xanthomonas cannabis TaxID=1885674 RepID=UPI001E6499DF|nr:enhanced serine sensitivity protein SseB C-terminal domain-containing protein [Xanthomonas campestris pv. zinniae]